MPPPPLYTRRASMIDRGCAAGIDLLIAFIPIRIAMGVANQLFNAPDAPSRAAAYVLHILAHLLPLAYTLFEVFKAGTPGKLFMGLVIARPDGNPADRWTLAFRWSTKQYGAIWVLLAAVILNRFAHEFGEFMTALVTIGCLQALDEDRRAWHDQWAGTAVWKKPKHAPLPERRPRPDWLPPEVEMQWPAQPGGR